MNKTTLKNDPALIGKLLSVEIEYIPTTGARDISSTASSSSEELISVAEELSVRGGKEIRVLTFVSGNGRVDSILNLHIDGKPDKRCGLHVHVDARHLGTVVDGVQLLSVEETYDRLTSTTYCKENMNFCFKKLVPKSRHNNRFCKWVSNRRFGVDRFSAFNFHSFDGRGNSRKAHGTIEFRMQGGTTNRVKIEMWALVCRFWLNYAANPANVMPTSWSTFIKTMPEPLRSFCVARRLTLHGTDGFELHLSKRVLQAFDENFDERA